LENQSAFVFVPFVFPRHLKNYSISNISCKNGWSEIPIAQEAGT
jgi:hypothetical protein